jgi:hypothetical protein
LRSAAAHASRIFETSVRILMCTPGEWKSSVRHELSMVGGHPGDCPNMSAAGQHESRETHE